MPQIVLSATGTFADIQSAQTQIGTAITNAGGTIQGQLAVILSAHVNTIGDIPNQSLRVSANVNVPNNTALQSLATNLQTVKTSFPNLTFAMNYNETSNV